jgi:hypothetical protein
MLYVGWSLGKRGAMEVAPCVFDFLGNMANGKKAT